MAVWALTHSGDMYEVFSFSDSKQEYRVLYEVTKHTFILLNMPVSDIHVMLQAAKSVFCTV
jgi:hypothetical protein